VTFESLECILSANDSLSLANSLDRRTLRTGAEFSNRFAYRILELAWSTLCLTHSLLSLVYSVTRFRNRRLAHVASCQPDIGAWHRLYTSALLRSQDSWSSLFIGTSYKDYQVKRRCVREKFTEWSLEVWMFKFYNKKCYVRCTCSSETKQIFLKHHVLSFQFVRLSVEYGRFRTTDLPILSGNVNE